MRTLRNRELGYLISICSEKISFINSDFVFERIFVNDICKYFHFHSALKYLISKKLLVGIFQIKVTLNKETNRVVMGLLPPLG